MASSEHAAAADFVKAVHEKLRLDAKILGVEEAWERHREDGDNLQKYASAMRELGAFHWENNYKQSSKAKSRVEWVYQFCQFYFAQKEFLKHRRKELEIGRKIGLEIDFLPDLAQPLKLLDVGSCYNPFEKYNSFEVLPIDLAPATPDVYKCDFLQVRVLNNPSILESHPEICELQAANFHIVVFSLLLEYFPAPAQRLTCCLKAYELLKTEGLLIIITPDSKHVGANAQIMKSWRVILARMGFSRIKYEKLAHLHCMAFRKSLTKEIPQRWASLQSEPLYQEIVIPQDFKKQNQHKLEKIEIDVDLFNELPNKF